MTVWQRRTLSVFVGLIGVFLAFRNGLPLPVLLGPIFACLIAALCGAPLASLGRFTVYMRTILGVAVGTSVTPALIHDLPSMASSLLFVPLFLLAIGGVGYPLFRHFFAYDRATAFYSAMPGGLQDMLVFGEEAGGNSRALSLIHATRVLFVVTIAPLVMTYLWQIDLHRPPGQAALSTPVFELLWMVVAAVGGLHLASRLGLFGASLLGPMLLATVMSLSGLITHRPPAELIWAAQFFLGLGLGVHYRGITLKEVRTHIIAGTVYSVLIGAISIGFFFLVSHWHPDGQLDVLLAFLPGGQGEMLIIAIVAGADLAYVVSHHLLRLVLVILISPLVARPLMRRRDR